MALLAVTLVCSLFWSLPSLGHAAPDFFSAWCPCRTAELCTNPQVNSTESERVFGPIPACEKSDLVRCCFTESLPNDLSTNLTLQILPNLSRFAAHSNVMYDQAPSEVPASTVSDGNGSSDNGTDDRSSPPCGCYQAGKCPKHYSTPETGIDISCFAGYETCCFMDDPWPNFRVTIKTILVPCATADVCRSFYGDSPLDVARYGLLVPCYLGMSRCVDFLDLFISSHTTTERYDTNETASTESSTSYTTHSASTETTTEAPSTQKTTRNFNANRTEIIYETLPTTTPLPWSTTKFSMASYTPTIYKSTTPKTNFRTAITNFRTVKTDFITYPNTRRTHRYTFAPYMSTIRPLLSTRLYTPKINQFTFWCHCFKPITSPVEPNNNGYNPNSKGSTSFYDKYTPRTTDGYGKYTPRTTDGYGKYTPRTTEGYGKYTPRTTEGYGKYAPRTTEEYVFHQLPSLKNLELQQEQSQRYPKHLFTQDDESPPGKQPSDFQL